MVGQPLACLQSTPRAPVWQAEAEGGSAAVQPFVEACYGYLPLVWAGTLAHYLESLLTEAGRILPVRREGKRSPGHCIGAGGCVQAPHRA